MKTAPVKTDRDNGSFTKLGQSVASSQLHKCRNSNQPHLLLKLPSSPSVPALRQKNPNFSSPAILQHALLIQFPHTFGSWTPPLLHIHYITGSHHTGTWFLIPLLCWWHTALSLSSTRLHGGHLCMDERTSPTAQPGKDWASCLPYHSNSTAGFHHHARFFYNYPIKFGQESWCNFRWPADFQRAHCKNCSIYTTSER